MIGFAIDEELGHMGSVGAVILFSEKLEETLEFYRALGLDLNERASPENGESFFATEAANIYFAIYPADEPGISTDRHQGGATQLVFTVPDLEAAVSHLQDFGGELEIAPEEAPWGLRAVVTDPEHRPVELMQQ